MDGRKALPSFRSLSDQEYYSRLILISEPDDESDDKLTSDDDVDDAVVGAALEGSKNVIEDNKHRAWENEEFDVCSFASLESSKNVIEDNIRRALPRGVALEGSKNVIEDNKHRAWENEEFDVCSLASLESSTNVIEDNKRRALPRGVALEGSKNVIEDNKHRAWENEEFDVCSLATLEDSKNVNGRFKHRASENRDCVYNFDWFDILFAVGSILLFLFDVITDVKLAVDYFLDAEWILGGVTTALIVGPSLVTCCFGLHWYFIDYKREKNVIKNYTSCSVSSEYIHITPPYVWFFRFFFTALQFGPVVRTIEYLYYGLKSRSKNLNEKESRRFQWLMLYASVDNCLLRLFESFLESAPQLSWQLYITITRNPDDDLIGTATRAAALLSSWCSLAMSLMSYHRSLRKCRKDKYKMRLLSTLFYFIWRACEVGARILCIAMFASAFEMWVFGILLLHWVVISGWLMNQRTTFYNHRCLERVFNIICGYVMLFCFLNLREGHTRYRFLIFYIIFYIENFFMLAFWFRFNTDQGTWYHLWGFIAVLILFILHIIFQLLYYSCFHPTGAIEYCLSCDKYTFYESVCYDVRPEIDDGIGSPNPRDTDQEIEMSN